MKKAFNTLLMIFLCLTLLLPVFASASSNMNPSPRFAYINNNSVGLEIDTTLGIATCDADCLAYGGYTVEVKCELQKYMGTYWVTIKSWIDTDVNMAGVEGAWAVYSGYTYRSYATFKIYSTAGTLLETDTSSKTVSYPKA